MSVFSFILLCSLISVFNNVNPSLFIQETKVQQQNEQKKNPGVSEYGPWICCNWAKKWSCSGVSFETILQFAFCTITKISLCCSLIKRFPNSHKRYSSHLKLSVLHRVAPTKIYLKFMTALQTLKVGLQLY